MRSSAWLVLFALGCAPQLRDGVFRCDQDGDCPPGFSCHADALCRRGAPNDAGSAADAERPDGGPRRFCEDRCDGLPLCFCADFDDVATATEGWQQSSAGGGAARFFIEDARSLPRSLELSNPGSPTGELGSTHINLTRTFLGEGRTIRLEGWLKLFPYPREEWSYLQFFSVTFGGHSRVALTNGFDATLNDWFIGASRPDGAGGLTVDSYPIRGPVASSSPEWVRFELEVTFAVAGRIVLRWNGSEVLSEEAARTVHEDGTTGTESLSAQIGVGTLGGLSPDVRMLYDDVVVIVE